MLINTEFPKNNCQSPTKEVIKDFSLKWVIKVAHRVGNKPGP